MKTLIVCGSTTGTTEAVAEDVAAAFDGATIVAAGDASASDFEGVDLLIFGASTWGVGDLQDDMNDFLETFASMDVSVKAGAAFGLGDSSSYADSFVDGIADMVAAMKSKSIKVVGAWPAEGYEHSESRSQEGDNFVGLPLDQENESDKTADRIAEWAKKVKSEVE